MDGKPEISGWGRKQLLGAPQTPGPRSGRRYHVNSVIIQHIILPSPRPRRKRLPGDDAMPLHRIRPAHPFLAPRLSSLGSKSGGKTTAGRKATPAIAPVEGKSRSPGYPGHRSSPPAPGFPAKGPGGLILPANRFRDLRPRNPANSLPWPPCRGFRMENWFGDLAGRFFVCDNVRGM